jgi:catechol 2,3-dioxygenase-like lactoylglutathione lyase family enzyme
MAGNELIRLLGTLVSGLTLALVSSPAMAAEPAVRAVGYDNVHIRVLDPAKAAEWYVAALGAKLSEPPAAGTAQVTFGATVVTIVKGSSIEPSTGTLIDHIGLSYRDLEAAVKRAEAAGAKVTSPPRESPLIFRYAYIEDPWGVRIEMVEDVERLGFHHVHLRVKDPAATLAWYEQQLGGERAKLRDRLDGVRFDGVWVFAMSSGTDQPLPPTAIQLVAFRVADVDTSMKALAAAGVKMTAEPRSLPALRYGFVEDPNGIRVEIVRRTVTP